MKKTLTTAEYLHQFLPTGFQLRMGERMTIPAFAELLFGFMMDVEKERFAEEGIAEEPDACRVRDYTDRLAWRIGSREYDRWEDAEEELRLRVEDDIDRFGRKTAAEASNGVNCCKFCNSSKFRQEDCPDAPQSSEEDGSL